MDVDPRLRSAVEEIQSFRIFVTISGAHLYGFASPDSDYDLRGSHVLPAVDTFQLDPPAETIELSTERNGIEIDLVSHDAKKYFSLLLKRNGYVLEQLFSPLVIETSAEHEELKKLGRGCITRFHHFHYLSFSESQWRLFEKESPPRVKPLLYVYRVLLTGIHLMKTGEIEANLIRLNGEFGLTHVDELIARKTSGPEKGTIREGDFHFHRREYDRLREELQAAAEESSLPSEPQSGPELNDLLIRLRLRSLDR